MKISKFSLVALVAIFLSTVCIGAAGPAPTPTPLPTPPPPGCVAKANFAYFSAPGSPNGPSINAIHPEGKKAYMLNIIGQNAGNMSVGQEAFMTSLSFVSSNPNAATWQIVFEQNMAQLISGMKLTSKCTGDAQLYPLNPQVRLFNQ